MYDVCYFDYYSNNNNNNNNNNNIAQFILLSSPLNTYIYYSSYVVEIERSLRRTDDSSTGALPSVACLRWWLYEATLHAARQRVQ